MKLLVSAVVVSVFLSSMTWLSYEWSSVRQLENQVHTASQIDRACTTSRVQSAFAFVGAQGGYYLAPMRSVLLNQFPMGPPPYDHDTRLDQKIRLTLRSIWFRALVPTEDVVGAFCSLSRLSNGNLSNVAKVVGLGRIDEIGDDKLRAIVAVYLIDMRASLANPEIVESYNRRLKGRNYGYRKF